jgi:hypothetical protein
MESGHSVMRADTRAGGVLSSASDGMAMGNIPRNWGSCGDREDGHDENAYSYYEELGTGVSLIVW